MEMTVRQFAVALAAALGQGWSVVPADPDRDFTEHRPHIQHETGPTFWLTNGEFGNKRGRLGVHCAWPLDHKGQEAYPYFSAHSEFGAAAPSISVANTKTPAQVAADVQRRFLPAFLPLWEKQAARMAGQTAYRQERHALASRVAALLLGEVPAPRQEDELARVWLGHRNHGISGVEFRSDEDAPLAVEVRCTVEELAELVKLFPPSKGVGQ